ncbi:MAG: hypothetical protein HQL35_13740 [Alphaproteobacteria bacterium]|nr:hypothetical protein [Alphaproteobacteria bacterium]
MRRKVSVLAVLAVVAGCQAAGDLSPGAEVQAKAETVAVELAKAQITSTVGEDQPLVYGAGLSDEFVISSRLRKGPGEVEMLTPDGVSVNDIPKGLDMWLSRIKDSGGTVKAQPKPDPNAPQTRGLFAVLIDVALFLVGVAKDEYVYSAADDYDARLIYDPSTGAVEKVVFIPRQR